MRALVSVVILALLALMCGCTSRPPQATSAPQDLARRARELEQEIRAYLAQSPPTGNRPWRERVQSLRPLVPQLLKSSDVRVVHEALWMAGNLYDAPELAPDVIAALDALLRNPKDEEGETRRFACEVLSRYQDRTAIPVLLRALKDPYFKTIFVPGPDGRGGELAYVAAYRAADAALRKITRASPLDPPAAYPQPNEPKTLQDAWQTWLETGEQAFAKVPAARKPRAVRLLVCGNGTPKVWQLDLSGRVERTWDLKGKTYCAIALRNGNVLISDYGSGIIEEYDRQGKVVWDTRGIPLPGSVHGIEELPNGNILIAHVDGKRVIEVNRRREIVWSYESDGHPASAQRLPNGNTLVCLWSGNRVIEITSQGKIVWAQQGLSVPHEATKLPNGRVLIADFGNHRVIEVDQSGKVVWSRSFGGGPCSAQRLADGRTVVSDWSDGIVIVSRDGETARQLMAGGNLGKVHTFVAPMEELGEPEIPR